MRWPALLLLGLTWPWLFACGGPPTLAEAPPSLRGRWETDAQKYADRWLEIRPLSVVWGMGHIPVDQHEIDLLEVEELEDGLLLYRFHYTETEGYDAALEIRLEPGVGANIRLGSRGERWQRVAS